jgi:(S)-sulfolactate dehydrogenase
MPQIVISEFMDEDVIARAFAGHDALYDPKLVDKPQELEAALASARVLVVRNRTQVRGRLLEAAPRLEMVGRLGVGLDNIDVAACRARGIEVRPASGANDVAVAEYVITAVLMLLRGAWHGSAAVASGAWPRMSMIGREAAGRQLGLIGFGAIARETATRARALGMRVVAFDPLLGATDPAWSRTGVRRTEFDALLAASDAVSLHVPLTDSTRRMIDAVALARLRKGAVLVNAARGGVVDEAALIAALRSGHLGGAALDVFETEPLDAEGGKPFAGIGNLILTPHIAGVTEESNLRVSEAIARAVLERLGA